MQIARETRPRDLEEFFSAVGAVRDVRIITDSRTGRSKGICYVEFWDEESVPLGLALNGQKLMKAPLQIQRTCAERNRAANATMASSLGFVAAGTKGPAHMVIENLHPRIDEKMLQDVFESFGRFDKCVVDRDRNGEHLGSGYVLVSFPDASCWRFSDKNEWFSYNSRNFSVKSIFLFFFFSSETRKTPKKRSNSSTISIWPVAKSASPSSKSQRRRKKRRYIKDRWTTSETVRDSLWDTAGGSS